jgi:Holliday junction resolvase RusA-like endonuclease
MSNEKDIQTLIINGKLISLNVYRNSHHFKLNKMKADWSELTKIAVLQQKIKPVKSCDIIFTFNFIDKRRRDLDNYSATIKFILDGLVSANVISDDNYEIVRSITILKGKVSKEFVKIEICEVIE